MNLSIADSTVALEDKQIDAAFFLLSAKTPVIKRLNSRIGLQLIGIEAVSYTHLTLPTTAIV